VAIAGLGYLIDGFSAVLGGDDPVGIGRFTFVGEVALIFWLVISGRRDDFRGQDDDATRRDLESVRR